MKRCRAKKSPASLLRCKPCKRCEITDNCIQNLMFSRSHVSSITTIGSRVTLHMYHALGKSRPIRVYMLMPPVEVLVVSPVFVDPELTWNITRTQTHIDVRGVRKLGQSCVVVISVTGHFDDFAAQAVNRDHFSDSLVQVLAKASRFQEISLITHSYCYIRS